MKKLFLILVTLVITLQVNAQCVSSFNVTNQVACDSLCNGAVAVQFVGGALPITLTYTDGVSVYGPFTVTSFWQIGGLCPGSYSITAVDASGDTCNGPSSFILSVAPSMAISVSSTNATCAGCNDGTATVNVSGGSPPYYYNWSNGVSSPTITGLAPGFYTIQVTDVNGCSDTAPVVIGIGSNGYYALEGQVYFDMNSNGVKDVGESGLGNMGINLQPDNINALTNTTGNYGFVVLPGTYDIVYTGGSGWNLTSSPSTYNVTVSSANLGGNDFGVYPDSTAGSACVALTSGFPRCFWNVGYNLTVYNNGFTMLSGAMTFTYDPVLTYISSTVTPVSQIGNVLTYTYANVPPGQTYTITVVLTMPAGGTVISNQLAITGSDSYGYQFALNSNLIQTVSCSFDPNDKNVQPPGIGGGNYVSMDSWLNYMIRFQNTGNDTAFKVVVIDTISSNLDFNTFELLSSSHPVNITTRPGNEVTFTFDDILLPDSNVNEPASNGYVLYRIKGLDANPDPTVINNTAYIYFDLNTPVVTNTTLTTFSDNFLSLADPGEANDLFELFPNPTNDFAVLRLKTPSLINYDVTILDINGRKVTETRSLKNGSVVIEANKLTTGTYFVEIISSENSKPIHMRLVKK